MATLCSAVFIWQWPQSALSSCCVWLCYAVVVLWVSPSFLFRSHTNVITFWPSYVFFNSLWNRTYMLHCHLQMSQCFFVLSNEINEEVYVSPPIWGPACGRATNSKQVSIACCFVSCVIIALQYNIWPLIYETISYR